MTDKVLVNKEMLFRAADAIGDKAEGITELINETAFKISQLSETHSELMNLQAGILMEIEQCEGKEYVEVSADDS